MDKNFILHGPIILLNYKKFIPEYTKVFIYEKNFNHFEILFNVKAFLRNSWMKNYEIEEKL